MKKLYELKEILCDELDSTTAEISKGKISQSGLDYVHKLTDTLKNVDKIIMIEEDGGYSGDGAWTARIDGEYGHGNSFAGRGGSRRGGGRRSGSYHEGYSRDEAIEETTEKLEDLMYDVDNPKAKEAIKKCLENLKHM